MSDTDASSSRPAQPPTDATDAAPSTIAQPVPEPPPPPPPRPTVLYSWRKRTSSPELFYLRDAKSANLAIDRLHSLSVVGFDQEWKPVFSKGTPENPVALIQLATPESVLLFQVSSMSPFPEKLSQLLENPDVVKTGVGIQNDVQKLFKDHRVSTRNCVDLSLMARSVDNARWKGKYSAPIGLARLVEEYENETLTKGKITRSNWEAKLSDAQLEYAANDAHAGLTLYNRLIQMAQSMPKPPKSVYYTFDCVRSRLCEPSGAQWRAWNPDYDPGPPPLPKVPKEPIEKEPSSTTIQSTHPPSLSSLLVSPFFPGSRSHSRSAATPSSRTYATSVRSNPPRPRQSLPSSTNPEWPDKPGPSLSQNNYESGISMIHAEDQTLHHNSTLQEALVEAPLNRHGAGGYFARTHGRGSGYYRQRNRGGRGRGATHAQTNNNPPGDNTSPDSLLDPPTTQPHPRRWRPRSRR